MIKIKDFTLASKNLGEGTCPPHPVPYTTSAHAHYILYIPVLVLVTRRL